jgi:hypothetical protein
MKTRGNFDDHPSFRSEPNERVCYVQSEVGYSSFIKNDQEATGSVIQTWEWAAATCQAGESK